MARLLNVASAQLGPVARTDSRPAVIRRLLELLRESSSLGCRVVVFPELALTTFFPRWYMEDPAEIDSFQDLEAEKRIQIFQNHSTWKEIHTSSSQFPGAGARQDEPQSIVWTVQNYLHHVQERRRTLDLIHADQAGAPEGVEFVLETSRLFGISEKFPLVGKIDRFYRR